jgi:hypothetical protein
MDHGLQPERTSFLSVLAKDELEPASGTGTQSRSENESCSSSLLSDAGNEPAGKSLGDRIFDQLEKSAYDEDKEFLPVGWIDELVTEEAVREELKCPVDKQKYLDQVIRFIFAKEDGAKKLFVITLLCGILKEDLNLVKAMIRFRKAQINDSCLPLNPDECSAFIDENGSFCSPWNRVRVRDFGKNQWAVLAPVFTDRNTKLTLEPGIILPIVGKIKGRETGAFGEVVQVTIHENHWFSPILRVSFPSPVMARSDADMA